MVRNFLRLCWCLALLPTLAEAQAFRYEVQINVCETEAALQSKLGLDTGSTRSTYLFDTRALDLNQLGLVVRLRAAASGGAELAVKAQGLTEAQMRDFVGSAGAKCEWDVHGTETIGSCTASTPVAMALSDPRQMADDVRKNFSAGQRVLLASAQSFLARIEALGPSTDRNLDLGPKSRSLQISKTPRGVTFIEFSQRTQNDPGGLRSELEQFLKSKSVAVCPDQGARRRSRMEDLLLPPRS